ncbi:hypothetical protein TNCV_1862241 [Trichonephila clavipes]|nr:hypothetical protein TNCV_1862241 [Trichonephila clavipes]
MFRSLLCIEKAAQHNEGNIDIGGNQELLRILQHLRKIPVWQRNFNHVEVSYLQLILMSFLWMKGVIHKAHFNSWISGERDGTLRVDAVR